MLRVAFLRIFVVHKCSASVTLPFSNYADQVIIQTSNEIEDDVDLE